jgi:branched-chain amino acid transport system substrate-binding protein
MRRKLSIACLAALAIWASAAAEPQEKVSDGVVRIGLIVDMSGPYSYLAGEDTITAARMAVEDFGGQVLEHLVDIV